MINKTTKNVARRAQHHRSPADGLVLRRIPSRLGLHDPAGCRQNPAANARTIFLEEMFSLQQRHHGSLVAESQRRPSSDRVAQLRRNLQLQMVITRVDTALSDHFGQEH